MDEICALLDYMGRTVLPIPRYRVDPHTDRVGDCSNVPLSAYRIHLGDANMNHLMPDVNLLMHDM